MKGERKQAGKGPESEAHIYYCEVLHRVLYPNTHENGFKKKKKNLAYSATGSYVEGGIFPVKTW
jgi:hypothetical protein